MPTPPEQLAQSLASAKRAGRRFEAAWRAAVEELRWPWDAESAADWQVAIEATRPEWQAAFEDRPTRNEDALSVLLARVEPDPDALIGVAAVRQPPATGAGPIRGPRDGALAG
jgi:hypothetical protein